MKHLVVALGVAASGCGRSPIDGPGAAFDDDDGEAVDPSTSSGSEPTAPPGDCEPPVPPRGPACSNIPAGITVLYDEVANGANVAVDDDSLYLLIQGGNPFDGQLLRMDKCGGDIESLASSGTNPAQMALTETHVIWTDFIGDGAVYSVPKQGGERLELAAADNPLAVATVGDTVYWGYNGIFQVPATGGAVEMLSEQTAVELIPQGPYLYVSSISEVGRLSLTTGGWEILYDGIFPDALEVGCEAIWWGDEYGDLVRGTLDLQPTVGAAPAAYRLARDEDWVYATNIDGELWAAPVAGGEALLLAEGLYAPFYVAVDRTHLYWTRTSDGSVSAMPNPLR